MLHLLGGHADPSDNRSIGQVKFRLTLQRPLLNQKLGLVKRKVLKEGVLHGGLSLWFCSCIASHAEPNTGFVEEMRFVAMKLHTKDQAPKEGGKAAAPQPFQKVTELAAVVL